MGCREGRHIYTDFNAELTRLAQRVADPQVAVLSAALTAPVGVTVLGRPGVGRAMVAQVLRAVPGYRVDLDGHDDSSDEDELRVVVVAETVKPEDLEMLAVRGPILTVLNKADLSGAGPGGPLARAQHRAAEFRARTGVPTVPMVALLADVALDDELIAALRVLAREPGDLTSTDAFVTAEHRLSPGLRARLLGTLDRFGVAHAVLALQRGVDASALPAMLRRISGIDRVAAQLEAAAAPVRYGRVRATIAELRALAVRSGVIADFLAADATVAAVMGAAVDVVEAAGLAVERGDDEATHLRRAVRWRHYGQGPVNALHRQCGADICRGSLRMYERAR